jgi:hypothetical protein
MTTNFRNYKKTEKPFKSFDSYRSCDRIEKLIESALCAHINNDGEGSDFMTTRKKIASLLKNNNKTDESMHVMTVIRNEKKMKLRFISRKKLFKGDNQGFCYYFDLDKITSTKEMYEEFVARFGKFLPDFYMNKIKAICSKKPYNWGE